MTFLERVISLLEQEYGALEWQPRSDPTAELIRGVLSQNTSDVNSDRAFAQLRAAFGSWEQVANAGVDEIAGAIRIGGLNRVKAKRLKSILTRIRQERGSLDVRFLQELPLEQARAWLRGLPGVGPKTAAVVLLFSLGMPALPVDTHVYRVSKRLGLIPPGVSSEKAHELLEQIVPPQRRYQFHINVLRLGRTVCKANRPLHHDCILQDICPKIM